LSKTIFHFKQFVSGRLALLLKFSLAWPEELKQLMRYLSVFNINL
jgi:hypothetical protein